MTLVAYCQVATSSMYCIRVLYKRPGLVFNASTTNVMDLSISKAEIHARNWYKGATSGLISVSGVPNVQKEEGLSSAVPRKQVQSEWKLILGESSVSITVGRISKDLADGKLGCS